MMRFYDQLRRQGQSVDRYEELLVASLDADNDRGAERLLRQTRFLAASFRAYEQRLASLTGVDEHGLRAHLIRRAAASPLRRVVVAVGDWIADKDMLDRSQPRQPGMYSHTCLPANCASPARKTGLLGPRATCIMASFSSFCGSSRVWSTRCMFFALRCDWPEMITKATATRANKRQQRQHQQQKHAAAGARQFIARVLHVDE